MNEDRKIQIDYTLKVRAEENAETKKKRIEGLAIPYNKRSTKVYGYDFEYIEPGAATEALAAGENILFLRSHEMARPFASVFSNTLKIFEKEDGVYFEAELGDTAEDKDLYDKVKRGVMGSVSWAGWTYKNAEKEIKEGKKTGLVIKKLAKIIEISVLARPAYTDTHAKARAEAEKNNTEKMKVQAETRLRLARAIVSPH